MSIAKIIELNAASNTSMEDAVRSGLKKCSQTVKEHQGRVGQRDQGRDRR
jgi:dodecin